MKRALILRTEFLAHSETFIREQMLACERWTPVLMGIRRIPGLDLNGLRVAAPMIGANAFVGNILWRLFTAYGVIPPGAGRRLMREPASLVHVHFGTDAVALWPIIRHVKMPVVVTLHGYDITRHRSWWEQGLGGWRSRRYPERLLDIALRPDVHFLAVSEAIRRKAIAYGISAAKVTVHHIGVDTDRFKPSALPITGRRRRILFTGRMVEVKGSSYLIEAFARVRQRVPDAELVMIGSGPLRAGLEQLASRLSVPVAFPGALSPDGVKAQLDEARVFCLPSVTAQNGEAEGFGMVLLEAQASGVPVVTSAAGGSRDGTRHGETGFVFAEKDVEALTGHLTQLLLDDSLAERMSLAARRFAVERFDIRERTRALERYYDEVLAGAEEAAHYRSVAPLSTTRE